MLRDPFLMKKLLKNEICGTLNTEEKSKHAAQEKKKKGRKTHKRAKCKRAVYPNRTYVSPITICNVFFFFFSRFRCIWFILICLTFKVR